MEAVKKLSNLQLELLKVFSFDMRVVIDTNVLLMSIPKKAKYRLIFDSLISGEYELVISNRLVHP